jgi:hypothetical protein
MDAPPVMSQQQRPVANSFADAFIRVLVCIAFGILGFWFPLWYEARIQNSDARFGFIFLYTLPVILVYAVYATVSLLRVYRVTAMFQRLRRFVLIPFLALFCWMPFIFVFIAFTRFYFYLFGQLMPK